MTELTFDQFARAVHGSRSAGSALTIAEALVSRLKIEKPGLERAATKEHGDPTIFPEKLTMWLEYVRNHWAAS